MPVVKNISDKELVGCYVVSIREYDFDNSKRGHKMMRARIKKLGDELVERGLLDAEVRDYIERD